MRDAPAPRAPAPGVPTAAAPDYAAISKLQRETWGLGDFSVIALSLMPVSDTIVASADPHAGQSVLDVACGSGNTALVAARRYCDVTGIDFVPSLLERARARAGAEGTPIRFIEADAQALPFEDASFDYVFSTFGVMFAPDQARAASELMRVCRPGGTIALANWTPDGAVGRFFQLVARYMPPPPGVPSPLRWGTEDGIHAFFGPRLRSRRLERRIVTEYFRSVDHAVDVFRTYFGPTRRAFSVLDRDAQQRLASDIADLFREDNRATDGTLALPLEYLEAIVVLT